MFSPLPRPAKVGPTPTPSPTPTPTLHYCPFPFLISTQHLDPSKWPKDYKEIFCSTNNTLLLLLLKHSPVITHVPDETASFHFSLPFCNPSKTTRHKPYVSLIKHILSLTPLPFLFITPFRAWILGIYVHKYPFYIFFCSNYTSTPCRIDTISTVPSNQSVKWDGNANLGRYFKLKVYNLILN